MLPLENKVQQIGVEREIADKGRCPRDGAPETGVIIESYEFKVAQGIFGEIMVSRFVLVLEQALIEIVSDDHERHRLGMKYRKAGFVPGKADTPDKQAEQAEYVKKNSNRRWPRPRAGSGWFFSWMPLILSIQIDFLLKEENLQFQKMEK